MDSNETRESGSDRRTFLQSLAAASAAGVLGTGAASGGQTAADAYHQGLQSRLMDEEGLPEGTFVYSDTEQATLDAFTLQGGDQGTETQFDVGADGVPITLGDRVAIEEDASNGYSYTYKSNITDREFSEGDVLLAVAYMRGANAAAAEEAVEVQAQFKYQFTDPDGETGYSDSFIEGTERVSLGSEWQRYYFPIEVGAKPDGSEFIPYVEFWTGFGQQTVEFGGVALLDYGTQVGVGDLPTTAFDYEYPGRAEDAEWRSAARERIDELRKTDFEVTVLDADGDPVPDADVSVEMQAHEYDWGSAIAVNQWPDGSETYRERFLDNFNKAVPENGLKVPAWEGRYGDGLDQDNTRAAIDWMLERDIPTRGHALVWSTYDWMGIDDSLSATEVNEEVKRLIRERAEEFEGELPEWDMHNHPLFYPEIWQDIGQEYVLDWWETANEADPSSQMYINELNIIAGDQLTDDYYDHIGWLTDNDAGVEGIGFMAHFGLGSLTPPTELLDRFDRFAEFGVPLQLTEFDIQINDRSNENEVQAQRDYLRDALTAAFSHEAVEGVVSWGFWEDEHWRPTGAYYDSDWTLRPHGEEYRRLLFEEWWTEESGTADGDGVYSGRGFEGTYEVVARDGERIGAETVEFTDDGASAEVQIRPGSIGDIDLNVDSHTLVGDDTVDLGLALTSEDGYDLPVPEGALSFESADKDVLMVDEDGVVSVAGEGTATVTVTVTAYGDTAAASARFAARESADLGDPALSDDASDLSVADSNDNVFAAGYASRQGDDSFFQKSEGGQAGSVTYRVPDGVAAFEVDAYVNNNATDSDLAFAVSSDGETFEPVAVDPTVVEAPNDSNGYYAFWTYSQVGGLPDDASYLRVTIPEGPEGYAMVVGAVDIWSEAVSLDAADPTGPGVVVDDLQAGATYEAPRAAGVTIADDESGVSSQSVTLNGDAFDGGEIVSRGRNTLDVSATNASGVTTATDFSFEVTRSDEDLIARLQPSATQGTVGERLTFQVIDTSGSGAHIDELEWTFDDGTTASGYWNAHRYEEPGIYTVELTATNSEGETTTDELTVWIAELEGVLAEAKPSATEAGVDERLTFAVEDLSGQNRWITDLQWEFGDGESAEGWWTEHRYDSAGTYTVSLTATDNLGYSTTDEVEITVS
ncbi:endo-1,4-beta-xylanase [Halosimplex carlsbadense]|nr:endo-1,4-beta-xylanase [Halosimplex carlsbadense]